MTAADQRPCLCGTCGRTFNRPKSIALCKPANTRAWAVMRSLAPDDLIERAKFSARFWVDPETVRAALNGDLAKVQQRVAYRAEHGLYADPDRVLAGTGR